MAEVCTWSVVQFTEDQTVEAVPTAWIQGDRCHWPSFPPDKMANAIRKCEPLNTCWASHPIKIFRNATFNEYMKARNKARIAEETSDLASETEMVAKRKRKSKKVFSSSSEDADTMEVNLPKPPTLRVSNSKANVSIEEENRHQNFGFKSSTLNCFPTTPLVQPAASCTACIEKDKNLKTIIEQNHLLRCMSQDILSEIKTLKELMKSHSSTAPASTTSVFERFPHLPFPLDTEEDLTTFNKLLTNEEHFNEWVTELVKIGGTNNYHFIKRVMHTLITNNLGLKFSWMGRKQKKPFYNTDISKLIIRASELTRSFTDRKETESHIQAWLRRAGDRTLYKQNKKL